MRRDLRRWHFLTGTVEPISFIEKIEPKIHRVWLSGEYVKQELEQALGELYIDVEKSLPERRPKYRVQAYRMFDGELITIFYGSPAYIPNCILEFTLPEQNPQEWLIKLGQKLPILNVSRVEYTIDIFCSGGSKMISYLFKVFWRNIVIPYSRNLRLLGPELDIANYPDRKNRTASFGNTKFYERGPDKNKDQSFGGWKYKDIDRLRLEFKAERNQLKSKKIDLIENLISFPHFTELNSERYQFRRAKESTKIIPQPWEPYPTENEQGNMGSFMSERKKAKDSGKNIHQYEEPISFLDPFVKKLQEAMVQFDLEWQAGWKRYQELCSKSI